MPAGRVLPDGINGVVIENRMTAGGLHWRAVGVLLVSRAQVGFCDLTAIPFRALRFDVDRTKQSHRQRAAIAFTAGGGSGAVEQVVAFFFGVEGVDNAVARSDQTARIRADVRAVVKNAVFEVQTDCVDRCSASGWLIVVGTIGIEQILKENLYAVADIHAQERSDARVCIFSVGRFPAQVRRSIWLRRLFVRRRSFPPD